MLIALATGGLWRVLWYSLVGGLAIAAVSLAMRSANLSWKTIRLTLISVYAVVYVWWFFANGIIIDRISVLWSFGIFLAVASVGKPWREWRRTALDLGLFVAMWIAYDESRGIADGLGMPIQVESVRNLDRVMFLGADGVVELQNSFLAEPGTVRWYDVIASCVYYSHFILPPVVLGILWWRNRHQWVRYMRRFATVIFFACTMFILLPTAPPWMAAGGSKKPQFQFDALPPLRRPTGNGWRHIGLDGFVEAWDTGRDWANEVAAMPSLHSAYALFVVVFFWPKIKQPWIRYPLLAYPLVMAVALMYFGEHYLIDGLAGWAIVGASFLIWNRIEKRLDVRTIVPDASEEQPSPDTESADVEEKSDAGELVSLSAAANSPPADEVTPP